MYTGVQMYRYTGIKVNRYTEVNRYTGVETRDIHVYRYLYNNRYRYINRISLSSPGISGNVSSFNWKTTNNRNDATFSTHLANQV